MHQCSGKTQKLAQDVLLQLSLSDVNADHRDPPPPRCARSWCNIVITRVSNLYGNERIINNLRFPCSLLQRAHFYAGAGARYV